MKTSAFLSATLAVLVAFSGCSRSENQETALSAATTPTANLTDLGPAPQWSLRRLDGSVLKSSELAGKVVVVDFWATWCPPCRQEIPGYVDMQRELESKGLVIVGVSLDQQGPSVVQDFAKRYNMNYPIVMGDEATTKLFGDIEAIPTTFLIDRQGHVRHRKVGAMERADYEPLVKSLL